MLQVTQTQLLPFMTYHDAHEFIAAYVPYNRYESSYGVETYFMDTVQLATVERIKEHQYLVRMF